MISEDDILTWGVAVVTLIIAIPAAFILDNSLHRRSPSIKPYKWGYYLGVGGVASGVIYATLLMATILGSGFKENSILILFLVFSLAIMITHFYIIKRQRWAWITGTILQLNPLLWIINLFYARNRWVEFSNASSVESCDSSSIVDQSTDCVIPSQEVFDTVSRDNYELAWNELECGNFDKGAWAQAFAEAEGNKEKAKAIYLRTRSRELSRQEEEKIAAQEREKCPYCGNKVDISTSICRSCGRILPYRRDL